MGRHGPGKWGVAGSGRIVVDGHRVLDYQALLCRPSTCASEVVNGSTCATRPFLMCTLGRYRAILESFGKLGPMSSLVDYRHVQLCRPMRDHQASRLSRVKKTAQVA